MKVRITKSRNPHYWYANMIGRVFEVGREVVESRDGFSRKVSEPWTIGHRIGVDDCEIVQEPVFTHQEKAFWVIDNLHDNKKIESQKQARVKAEELAAKYPGKTFSVYRIDSLFKTGEKRVVYYE